MTMPMSSFSSFSLNNSKDKYYSETPSLKLDDLPPKHDGEIKVSVMMSTYNRRAQLQRTLETLARQEFRAFEVLLNDDGSTQDMAEVVGTFSNFLNLRYFQTPRTSWRSCPSKAFKMMLPHAAGEVVAISHPEIMIDYGGVGFLYNAIKNKDVENSHRYVVGRYEKGVPVLNADENTRDKWAILRPGFIDEEHYPDFNGVDWHSSAKNIQAMPGFWEFGGLGGKTNSDVKQEAAFPWWFVGAGHRDCSVWKELPEFLGHGIVDMWLCDFRRLNEFTDIISTETMCYHQPHVTTAFAPEGENLDASRFARKVEN